MEEGLVNPHIRAPLKIVHKYEEQGQGSILSAFNNPRYLVNHYGGHLFDHPDSQISNPVSPTNRSKLSMRLKS